MTAVALAGCSAEKAISNKAKSTQPSEPTAHDSPEQSREAIKHREVKEANREFRETGRLSYADRLCIVYGNDDGTLTRIINPPFGGVFSKGRHPEMPEAVWLSLREVGPGYDQVSFEGGPGAFFKFGEKGAILLVGTDTTPFAIATIDRHGISRTDLKTADIGIRHQDEQWRLVDLDTGTIVGQTDILPLDSIPDDGYLFDLCPKIA